jgi:hypothetical protein
MSQTLQRSTGSGTPLERGLGPALYESIPSVGIGAHEPSAGALFISMRLKPGPAG